MILCLPCCYASRPKCLPNPFGLHAQLYGILFGLHIGTSCHVQESLKRSIHADVASFLKSIPTSVLSFCRTFCLHMQIVRPTILDSSMHSSV